MYLHLEVIDKNSRSFLLAKIEHIIKQFIVISLCLQTLCAYSNY